MWEWLHLVQRAQVAPAPYSSSDCEQSLGKFVQICYKCELWLNDEHIHILESKGQCNLMLNLMLGKHHSSGMPSGIFIKSDTNLQSFLRMNWENVLRFQVRKEKSKSRTVWWTVSTYKYIVPAGLSDELFPSEGQRPMLLHALWLL